MANVAHGSKTRDERDLAKHDQMVMFFENNQWTNPTMSQIMELVFTSDARISQIH